MNIEDYIAGFQHVVDQQHEANGSLVVAVQITMLIAVLTGFARAVWFTHVTMDDKRLVIKFEKLNRKGNQP